MHPDCGWVLDGEGEPTRKYDGTCVRLDEADTYELCGPKVNSNPEGYEGHRLVRHETAEVLADVPRDYDGLTAWLLDHPQYEGLVWHHPDGRMAKLKYRDALVSK